LLRLDGTPLVGARGPLLGGTLAATSVDTCDGQCEQVPGTYSARHDEPRLRNVPSSRAPSQRPIPTRRLIVVGGAL